uniref:YkgJ family cysteine cluster protein n=1 Tax=Ignisphaera aggregans TaxID=334771 RepID=A0A7C4BE38_9CREN
MVIFKCLLKGYCCKKYWIPVTHLDLLRIELYAGIKVNSNMLSLYEVSLYEELSYPYVVFSGEKYFLALNSKEDGSCLFLSTNGRCSIHPYKPLVCRFYPFVYTEKGDTIEIELNNNAIGECPGIILDGRAVPEDIKRDLAKLARARMLELRMWNDVAMQWNESPYSKKDFNEVGSIFVDFIMRFTKEDMKRLREMNLWLP